MFRKLPQVMNLSYNDEEIVLFSSLNYYIFSVYQVVGRDFAVERVEFFLVYAYASALCEFPHLAFRGEALCCFGQQVDGFYLLSFLKV